MQNRSAQQKSPAQPGFFRNDAVATDQAKALSAPLPA
jgi:hypothetical protein